MKTKRGRRDFLKASAFAGTLFAVRTSWSQGNAPSDRLRFAAVGVGGRGSGDVWETVNALGGGEKGQAAMAALCDVDETQGGKTMKAFPQAAKYQDFREMLEKEEKNIDAVIVATPDHTHAPAAVMGMKMGKHCYCEKPLTYSVFEARMMRQVATEKKLATQMGNQGTAGGRFREGVEVVWSGLIGDVKEIYVWTNRPVWPQGLDAVFYGHSGVKNALHGPKKGVISAPIRDTVAWDLWLGPAPERPYDPIYLPFNWRGWFDYGTGALGDMACHTMNLPYMALRLGAPTTVEAEVSCLNPETYPEWSKIQYEFPVRENMPAATLYWFDGRENSPKHFAERLQRSLVEVGGKPAAEVFKGQNLSGSGSLMVGTKGMIYSTDDYGNDWRLLPQDQFSGYKAPPPTLPRTSDHHLEWIQAIKGGKPALSNFDYAGPLTEMVLLGVVALKARGKIEWDSGSFSIKNNPDAEKFLRREYRKGWTL
jgi:predicted dehydrogenase